MEAEQKRAPRRVMRARTMAPTEGRMLAVPFAVVGGRCALEGSEGDALAPGRETERSGRVVADVFLGVEEATLPAIEA